ncbi:MAG: hypothetical protein WCP00_02165 [bacterium]
MNKQKNQKYKLSSYWKIEQDDKSLVISGGADARYEIELESNEVSFFSSLRNDKTFYIDELDDYDRRVFEELVTAEIVVPELQKGKVMKIAILGDGSKLKVNFDDSLLKAEADKAYDLALVVRTNSTYAELLNKIDYQNITKPHLFLDLAFHHTISIGPLVFPGETACIACLQGRISSRWGDESPPIIPQISNRYLGVASELVSTEINRIANNDVSLTNKTISWNFLDRSIKKDQLLKVPLCPICTKNSFDLNGLIVLPWNKV